MGIKRQRSCSAKKHHAAWRECSCLQDAKAATFIKQHSPHPPSVNRRPASCAQSCGPPTPTSEQPIIRSLCKTQGLQGACASEAGPAAREPHFGRAVAIQGRYTTSKWPAGWRASGHEAQSACCRKTRARCRELIQGTAGRASAGPALRKPPEALCRGSPSRLATRPNQSLLPRPQQPPGRAARPVHAHRTQNPGRAFGHTSEQGACTVATRAEHVRSRPTGLRRLLASPRLYFSPRDCLSGAPACKFPTISRISTFRLTKDSI